MVITITSCLLLLPVNSARAVWGDGGAGWAQIPYLIKILSENIKRYQQLRAMIRQAKNSENLVKMINEGINNAAGLLLTLPIKDAGILEELKRFQDIITKVEEIYGSIPKSAESALFLLHDKTAAEGLKVTNSSKEYAEKQEENAKRVFAQASNASPKGAQRMTAQTNAQILHAINQLIKVNAQMLKLQSQQLANENKHGKDSASHFNKVQKDIKESFKKYKGSQSLPRF